MAAVMLIVGLWATWTYLQAQREQKRSEFLIHTRQLTEAQTAFNNGEFDTASDKVDALIESPRVGRQAELLHAQLTLEQEGPNAAIPELEDLVGFLDLIMISVREVLNMYESEFLVKLTIFRDFEEGAIEIGVVSNYLTIWGIEPNIEQLARDKLLKDLDEHVELLRDVFAGKTGIRIPDAYKKIQL